jgi:antitoxin component HigA of HigAB toxin-antitoxin module
MVTPDFIEKLKQVLETRGVTQADMSYIVASLWTQDHVPEIQNENQYQEYLTLWRRLNAAGVLTNENFTRSPEGIYLDSIGARLIEWEEQMKSGHPPEPSTLEELLDFIRAGFRED